jgi:hypothetical protein
MNEIEPEVILDRSGEPMKIRKVVTSAGYRFDVPEYIVRVDEGLLTGWKLRYGEWTDYPDIPAGDEVGAKKSLDAAISEMKLRIETLGK